MAKSRFIFTDQYVHTAMFTAFIWKKLLPTKIYEYILLYVHILYLGITIFSLNRFQKIGVRYFISTIPCNLSNALPFDKLLDNSSTVLNNYSNS